MEQVFVLGGLLRSS